MTVLSQNLQKEKMDLALLVPELKEALFQTMQEQRTLNDFVLPYFCGENIEEISLTKVNGITDEGLSYVAKTCLNLKHLKVSSNDF